jgi:hypothetical protein
MVAVWFVKMAGMTEYRPRLWVTEEKRWMAAGRERKKRWAEQRKMLPREAFRKEKAL